MLPVLLDLKYLKIYTFGVFLVLAFFWGSFILWKNIRLTSHKENEIFDGMFLAMAGGLFVSRLVYVILNFDKFGFDVLKFILINGYPGLSMYGALLGAFLTLFIFFYFKKINFRSAVDYFITPIFIALVFGKLGSFFSGSEVGVKTQFPLSIKYVGYDGVRHLTPFYEAVLFALGAYVSYRLIFEVRKEKYVQGSVFYFFCWSFALIYLLFDKIKANPIYLASYSINGMVSAILLLLFTIYYLYYFRNSLINYGKPAFKKITKKFSGGFGKRSEKVTRPDRNPEKK